MKKAVIYIENLDLTSDDLRIPIGFYYKCILNGRWDRYLTSPWFWIDRYYINKNMLKGFKHQFSSI